MNTSIYLNLNNFMSRSLLSESIKIQITVTIIRRTKSILSLRLWDTDRKTENMQFS